MTKVTRVEVIHRGVGREYTNYNVNDAWIDIQDEGRTIKVFINESPYEESNSDNNSEVQGGA